jgi:uncharacterized protein YegL
MSATFDTKAIRFPKLELPNSPFNGLSPIVVFAEQGLQAMPVNGSSNTDLQGNNQSINNFELNRVVFIIDSSISMKYTMENGQTKLDYLKQQLQSLPDNYLPQDTKLSLITFNHRAQDLSDGINKFSDLKSKLDQISYASSTNYASALREAQRIIQDDEKNSVTTNRSLIIFLSDGLDKIEKDETEKLVRGLRRLNASTFFVGVGHDYNMKRIINLASLAGFSGWSSSTVGDNTPELDVFNKLIPNMLNQILGQEHYLKVQADGNFQSLSIATDHYRKAIDPSNLVFAGYSSEVRAVLFEKHDNLSLRLKVGRSEQDLDEFIHEVSIYDSSDVAYLYEQLAQGIDSFQQVLIMEAIVSQNLPMLISLKDFVDPKKANILNEIINFMQKEKLNVEIGNQELFNDISQAGSIYARFVDGQVFNETSKGKGVETIISGNINLHSGNLGHIDEPISSKQLPPAKLPNAKAYQNIATDFKPKFLVSDSDIEVDLSSIFYKKKFTIGRQKSMDLFLRNEKISRTHVSIDYIDGVFYITDLNSRNGTYLNGKRLNPNESMPLQKGDKISICDLKLEFTF